MAEAAVLPPPATVLLQAPQLGALAAAASESAGVEIAIIMMASGSVSESPTAAAAATAAAAPGAGARPSAQSPLAAGGPTVRLDPFRPGAAVWVADASDSSLGRAAEQSSSESAGAASPPEAAAAAAAAAQANPSPGPPAAAAPAAVCRICFETDSPEPPGSFDPMLYLGCNCRAELARAHGSCAIKWWSSRGTLLCEVCAVPIKALEYPPPPPPAPEPPPELGVLPPQLRASLARLGSTLLAGELPSQAEIFFWTAGMAVALALIYSLVVQVAPIIGVPLAVGLAFSFALISQPLRTETTREVVPPRQRWEHASWSVPVSIARPYYFLAVAGATELTFVLRPLYTTLLGPLLAEGGTRTLYVTVALALSAMVYISLLPVAVGLALTRLGRGGRGWPAAPGPGTARTRPRRGA